MSERLKQQILDQALAQGFADARFTRACLPPEAGDRLSAFVAANRHGDMGWMADTLARRKSPTAMWPDAKTAIVLATRYTPETDPLLHLTDGDRGVISVYAQSRDYHDIIKKRLKRLARWILEAAKNDNPQVKVFVDTAPILEKPLAQQAGLGWQGKHTNLVSRTEGSWLFLGEILTTLDLPEDPPEQDHCGSCRACLDICPTNAFPTPYTLDATRCISYLTIEHKGKIPDALKPLMGNRIFGCDDCLAVCPWNKFATKPADSGLPKNKDLDGPSLANLLTFDDQTFRDYFRQTPVKRIGWVRFVRNILIAIGNSQNREMLSKIKPFLAHEEESIRDSAQFAFVSLKSKQDNELKIPRAEPF